MYCQKCGANNPDNARFCSSCGCELSMSTSDNSTSQQDVRFLYVEPAPLKKSKIATVALVFSILAALFPIGALLSVYIQRPEYLVFAYSATMLGVTFLIPAVILSLIALTKSIIRRINRVETISGLVKSIVALCLSIILPIVVVAPNLNSGLSDFDINDINKVNVTVVDKKSVSAGGDRYNDSVEFVIKIDNKTGDSIKGIKGILKVYDMYGEFLYSGEFELHSFNPIQPHGSTTCSVWMEVSPFSSDSKKVYEEPFDYLQFEFIIDKVVYLSGKVESY